MSGPPDKWTDFKADGLTDQQVLDEVNKLAKIGYYTAAFALECTNGKFVFVGGYSSDYTMP